MLVWSVAAGNDKKLVMKIKYVGKIPFDTNSVLESGLLLTIQSFLLDLVSDPTLSIRSDTQFKFSCQGQILVIATRTYVLFRSQQLPV